MNRTFEDKPAIRSNVPLVIGLFGPSGGGKTFSGLRLATGIQTVIGGDIFGIDTEANRMLHYADKFKFRHIDFKAPFGSLDYLEAIRHCVNKGAKTIIVDSMSHEHENDGGYLLTQEAELDRMAGDDWAKRERCKMAAWIKPSKLRQQMINGILQLQANFIFCFRAKEKVKPSKDERGKSIIAELGYMPIAGEALLFEMTASALLLPRSDGIPEWNPQHSGEKFMMKYPAQFKGLLDGQLSESMGEKMARWAKGDSNAAPATTETREARNNLPVSEPGTNDDGSEIISVPLESEVKRKGPDYEITIGPRILTCDERTINFMRNRKGKDCKVWLGIGNRVEQIQGI